MRQQWVVVGACVASYVSSDVVDVVDDFGDDVAGDDVVLVVVVDDDEIDDDERLVVVDMDGDGD